MAEQNNKVKKTHRKFKLNPESLDTIISRVEIVDIKLLDSYSRRIFEDFDINELTIQEKREFETGEEEPLGTIFMGICRFGIRGMQQNEGHDPVEAFKIEGSFLLTYVIEDREGISTDDVGAFIMVNGIHHAWPFWRELVHNLSSRMGIEPPTIPVLPPKYKFKDLVMAEAGEAFPSQAED
jgi:hypothetical protein